MGSINGMENKLVSRAGYPIWQIDVQGLKRSLSISNIKAAYKAIRSVHEAEKILREFMPNAVIGTGGYVCYPVIKAAAKMGIYTALHESNSVPGLAVKMLKKEVDRIFVSFQSCGSRLGVENKCVYSGNPIKADFSDITREEARNRLEITGKYRYVVVSFGGSLGSQTLNRIALKIMKDVTSKRSDVLHVHSCGKNYAEDFSKELKRLGLSEYRNIRVSEYIYDMPIYLRAADTVICRSGAMTLAELSAASVPSVLVPSPNVTANHQYENALEYSRAGAAFAIDEKDVTADEKAIEYVLALLSNAHLRIQMSEKAFALARPDSAEIIVNEIINGIKKRG